ncbi:putative GNAT family N-acyltransferase [Virgibacillus natechei]|uniref:GNAT family N-acyltransferase n=1 Tax=Virgibacillus natechei TaxID=1216297 RepID=A0ABS4IDS9_9BACI|nr:GNAT family N-acetyltransferase [Virgibacillus natechei]MBP1969060.1 putative GNAT family N-acyltransferase [Virgibacillus natechei]UZD14330.1 GNAT family N-acetyltransferase [Virgibacillus natechei]
MNVKIAKTTKEIEQAYNIRTTVFVEEQEVPAEEELDEHDDTSTHFIGYLNGQPIAASRLRYVNGYGKLERICVLKDHRGKSHGKELIREMEDAITNDGYEKSKLNGQTHAVEFYQKLGYETISGEFMDAGIPHVTMVKKLPKIQAK